MVHVTVPVTVTVTVECGLSNEDEESRSGPCDSASDQANAERGKPVTLQGRRIAAV